MFFVSREEIRYISDNKCFCYRLWKCLFEQTVSVILDPIKHRFFLLVLRTWQKDGCCSVVLEKLLSFVLFHKNKKGLCRCPGEVFIIFRKRKSSFCVTVFMKWCMKQFFRPYDQAISPLSRLLTRFSFRKWL